MHYQTSILALAAVFSSVHAHGTLESAVGESGQSRGFKVDDTLARNCSGISPCQQDSTIIRDSEIALNIVNACGRTQIDGNIDIGAETENAIAANAVTTVRKGSQVAVTIHQVNADGAGPYECDLDETSNAASNFIPLTVTNNVPGANGLSQVESTDFTINVQLPDDFNCIGASTGDICTVRCRNNAIAGPFGGCFAVQQLDSTGRGDLQAASTITTAGTLDGINKQIAQNKKDLPAAIAAIAAAGAVGGNAGASVVSALLPDPTPVADGNNNQNNGQNFDPNQNGQNVDQNGQVIDQNQNNGQNVDQNGQNVDQNGQVIDQNQNNDQNNQNNVNDDNNGGRRGRGGRNRNNRNRREASGKFLV